ncbi:MAG: universal stress protein [Bacteroidetes bacterium]|nr:universal stress protein [Bacteroidota bacterium]
MKKILVGIDFLESSINALKHAISIANNAKCDVLMLWVHRPEYDREVFLFEPEKLPEIIRGKFEDLIREYQPDLTGGKLEYKIREGKVYKELCREAEESEADMIIVGTHGSSGFEEFWIGSNANKIVSASSIPIITIRAGIDVKTPLSRIVIPIDSTIDTRQKVPFTSYLAKIHNAEIHILAVYTTKIEEVRARVNRYAQQVAEYLTDEGVRYTMSEADTENIREATIEYALKVKANLISIMTEQERTTANLWLGPYAQQMVNHSPIPVLSIHPKELVRTATGG